MTTHGLITGRCPHRDCSDQTTGRELVDDGERLWLVCSACKRRWNVPNTDANLAAAIRGATADERDELSRWLTRYRIARPEHATPGGAG